MRVSAISVPQAVEELDNKALEDVMTNSNPSVENLKAMKAYCDFMIDNYSKRLENRQVPVQKLFFGLK